MVVPFQSLHRTLVALFFASTSVLTHGQFAAARLIHAHQATPGLENTSAPDTRYVDLDGDGHEDIIRYGDPLSRRLVWQRWIPGGFEEARPIGDPNPYIFEILLGDVDGNGWTDVVIPTDAGFSTILNSGYGVFLDAQLLLEDEYVYDYPGIADLNGDGLPDLFAGYGENHRIYLNQGAGEFGPYVQAPIDPMYPVTRALDLDGDGDLDLINDDPLQWYENDGNANFGPMQTIALEPGAFSITLKDITGDGLLDVMYRFDQISSAIHMIQNLGGGAFATNWQLVNFFHSMRKDGIEELDIDGDGDFDLLTRNTLYRNTGGSWQFVAEWYGWNVNPSADRFMDVDDDGDMDVIGRTPRNGIGWYENLGNGEFATQSNYPPLYPAHEVPTDMAIADLDGDGDLDIALPNSGVFDVMQEGSAACWLPNDGTGQFGTPRMITDSASLRTWILTGDIDGDGLVDVILPGGWRPNLGEGVFGPMRAGIASTTEKPYMVDMDGDGDLDFYWRSRSFLPRINDGVGNFTSLTTVPSLSTSTHWRFTDVDGDGRLDMIGEGYNMGGNPQGLRFFRQTALLEFTEEPITASFHGSPDAVDGPLLVYPNSVKLFDHVTGTFTDLDVNFVSGLEQFMDINGDGAMDLLFHFGTLGWCERTGPASFGPFVPFNSPVQGLRCDFQGADLDGNGIPDLVIRSADMNAILWHENVSDGFHRLSGTVFVDVDANGILDAGEPGLGYIYPVVMDQPSWQAHPDTAGNYSLYTTIGTHTVHVEVPSYWQATPTSHTATVDNDTPLVDGLDFGLTPVYDTTAFAVWSNFGNLHCLTTYHWQWYQTHITTFGVNNLGTTLPACRLDVVLSDGLNFLQPSVAPVVNGDTLTWTFAAPYFSQSFEVGGRLTYSGTSTDLHAQMLLYVTGSNGADSLVATAEWDAQYFCSWDPNDKAVQPAGHGPLHAVDKDIDRLIYTIRFQNTGNAPAYDVMIRDALSPHLDRSTLHVLGTSHPLTGVHVENDGEVVFRYDGIMLPDSVNNEPESHGFITFSIAPRSDIPNETRIENTAAIHFDFNEPVITNTVLSTLVDCDLFQAAISEGPAGVLMASAGETHQWFLNDEPIPGADETLYEPELPGSFTVRISDRYGCVNTSAPYTILPTGLQSVEQNDFVLSPNPALDAVRMLNAHPLHAQDRIVLLNVQGRQVAAYAGNGSLVVDIARNGLASGMYLLRVDRADGTQRSARLIFE